MRNLRIETNEAGYIFLCSKAKRPIIFPSKRKGKSEMMKQPVVPQAQISEKKMGLLTYPDPYAPSRSYPVTLCIEL